MSEIRYLLAGYHGFGNRGDDLLTLVVARALAASPCRPRLFVLSGPQPGQEIYAVPGVEILPRRRNLLTREVLHQLPFVHALIYCGGTLFSGRNAASDFSYALPAIVARLLARPRVFYGQGFQALPGLLLRRLVCLAWSQAHLIHLRDEDSLQRLRAENITGQETLCSVDPVFALHQPGRFLARPATAGSRKIAVNLRPLPSATHRAAEEIAILERLAGHEGYILFLVPMSDEDHALHRQRLESVRSPARDRIRLVRPDLPTDALFSLLSGMDASLGLRLHFHILSLLAGTPCLALSYDAKVDALFHQWQWAEFCLPAAGLDPVLLAARLGDLLARRRELSAYALKRAGQAGDQARRDLQMLVGLLCNEKETKHASMA